MKYKVVLEESEEGFAVSVPGLPGCHSQGGTEQEAIENRKLAIQEYLQVVEEMNLSLSQTEAEGTRVAEAGDRVAQTRSGGPARQIGSIS